MIAGAELVFAKILGTKKKDRKNLKSCRTACEFFNGLTFKQLACEVQTLNHSIGTRWTNTSTLGTIFDHSSSTISTGYILAKDSEEADK